jgi:uridine phosphorylase
LECARRAGAGGLAGAFDQLSEPVLVGSSWTTDAPYRETAAAIEAARRDGIACVEMEAAGLYAYAAARGRTVVCLAHITNAMATAGDDFEKGADNGASRRARGGSRHRRRASVTPVPRSYRPRTTVHAPAAAARRRPTLGGRTGTEDKGLR